MKAIQAAIARATRLLPPQGPITSFVYINPLLAFEETPFQDAVAEAARIYGGNPYLPEERYRAKLASGRIRRADLEAVLEADLQGVEDLPVSFTGTRFELRMAMLEHELRWGPEAELQWLIAETDAYTRFHRSVDPATKRLLLESTRNWIGVPLHGTDAGLQEMVDKTLRNVGVKSADRLKDREWEAVTLQLIGEICHAGVARLREMPPKSNGTMRHRDLILEATGIDVDRQVQEILVPFCASYLDQGLATWSLPDRSEGFLRSFARLFAHSHPQQRWLSKLPGELRRILNGSVPAETLIAESLDSLGVAAEETDEFLTRTMLALKGWAGMLWQMEMNAEWVAIPAPPGSLTEYVAVKLLLDRLVVEDAARTLGLEGISLSELRRKLRPSREFTERQTIDQRAYILFQLAQIRGWTPRELYEQSPEDWQTLVGEIEAFDNLERRRIYHLAYERQYRIRALDALTNAAAIRAARRRAVRSEGRPAAQVISCIDDREESFRRHLEEVAPRCETYGAPGFFAVVMYFKSTTDVNFRPLCPFGVKPAHWVTEDIAYSLVSTAKSRNEARRLLGRASHRWHVGSRSFLGGILTAAFGSLASIPMIARILFPRWAANLRQSFGSVVEPPPVTELRLLREVDPPASEGSHLGYSQREMAAIVKRLLQDIGLTKDFARIVMIMGHGSGSLNNPHESSYHCGACSGGRGGPNARAFAEMANDPSVRRILAESGLNIPDDTHFIGSQHNTCNENMTYFDLDRIPRTHRREFELLTAWIDEARHRNAQERCRRFVSAPLGLGPKEALAHVQGRSEDLSQVRPEYDHSTNALCFVGRREWSKGLFLDRRAFMQSYDPTQDDEEATILNRILTAAVPVCSGINLVFYFSTVDTAVYGCGTKLPHNITSLLGVMEGPCSDLRTGMYQQVVEFHEAMRILFVIDTTPEKMLGIIRRNPDVGRLVVNEWVQLAVIDPDSGAIQLYDNGRFQPYQPESKVLAKVASSKLWTQGSRDHLDFAWIESPWSSHSPDNGKGTP